MNLIFDDNGLHTTLAPLTLTRPVAALRVGILTVAESWKLALGEQMEIEHLEYKTEEYLTLKYREAESRGLHIAGNIKPTPALVDLVCQLGAEESLHVNGEWIATNGIAGVQKVQKELPENEILRFTEPWHLFQMNGAALKVDFNLLTKNKTTQQLSATNQVIGNGEIFIEEGARIECATLNTMNGPIYIGKNSEIMEGAMVRGPFALGEHSVIKMGAKMYGDSTIGPHCKVGGEVANSILIGYSNKGHDGYMGNSVIGEWCNFGADTNTSNLKNNYSNVRFYSYETFMMEETGVQFCGVIMGDHSKTSINTMLNTATSVGVCCNIFGNGFPPKHLHSFSWGGIEKVEKFELEKAFEVATNVMKRRGLEFSEGDKNILSHLYEELA